VTGTCIPIGSSDPLGYCNEVASLTLTPALVSATCVSSATESVYNLGYLYSTGMGVPKDPGRAFQLWTIAARFGNSESHPQQSVGAICGSNA
jgi:TPR repeat protein